MTHNASHFILPETKAVEVVWNHNINPDYVNSTSTQGHVHPWYELYVYIKGDISFLVNSHIFSLHPGDMIFTKPNTYHHSICHKECIHEHFCIYISTTDPEIRSLLDSLASACYLHFEEETRREILDLLYTQTNTAHPGNTNHFEYRSNLYRLIVLLRHNIESPPLSFQYPELLQKILSYIELNYAQISSVSEISKHFFISQATMERLFKKYLHMTPHRYLESTKLAGASRGLFEGKSVTAVALENGFVDCSHFIFLFRKRFGLTPNQYRKNYQPNS